LRLRYGRQLKRQLICAKFDFLGGNTINISMNKVKLFGYLVLALLLYIICELAFGVYKFKFDHVNVSLGNDPAKDKQEGIYDLQLDLVGTFLSPIPFLGVGFHKLQLHAKVIKNVYYDLIVKRVDNVVLPNLESPIELMNLDFRNLMLLPSLSHQDRRTITITLRDINYDFIHETTNYIYSKGLVNGTSFRDIATAMMDYYDVQLTMSFMPSVFLYNCGEFYPSFLPIPSINFLLSDIMDPGYTIFQNNTSSGRTNNTLSKNHKRDRRRKPNPVTPSPIPTARPSSIPIPTVNSTSNLDKRGLFAEETAKPSSQPSRQPSRQPSSQPTSRPSRQPTSQPSTQPP